MQHYDVIIVGAGHGGAQAALMLRQLKFEGAIAVIGDEPEYPYERPPLSKEYFSGEKTFERIMIRQPAFWEERSIDMILNERVNKVDAVAHSLATLSGKAFTYGKLIWATGGSPRRLSLPGAELPGIHVVRTRADADAMMKQVARVTDAVVIGGGYVGLEAAAVLSKLGKKVTLLEALDRLLARVAGEPLSRFYEKEHRAHGVDVRLNVSLAAIEGEAAVTGVRLKDGTVIPAQMVIVGIGIIPAVQPLIDAGAAGSNGVDVNEFCQTSLPDVFAIGDCAAHDNPYADGLHLRLESVQNANDQANVAAKFITGTLTPYDAVPWFWSNQYDLKLQTVGLLTGHDDLVIRGDPATRSFSVIYLKQGRVIALDCVNAMKDYVQGKALVVGRFSPAKEQLADAATPLKELATAQAQA